MQIKCKIINLDVLGVINTRNNIIVFISAEAKPTLEFVFGECSVRNRLVIVL